jgi:solute carrier family 25 uncoupling protein 27
MDINYRKLLLIKTSACIAETSTYPMDYIKTRMQINSQKKTFYGISEGILRSNRKLQIYDGLKPALLRHCIYTMLRINIYETLRDGDHISNKFLIGSLSGGIAQLIASPCDLLKIRYITDMSKKNITIPGTIRSIYNEGGIMGLWKGVGPNVSRAMLVNLGELATYDIAKSNIKENLKIDDSIPVHMMSSICSGLVSSACCTPADVIKSRMMQQNSPYKNIGQCVIGTVREEGILSLYKGFFPIWFRLAPWQLIFWVSYEKMRVLSGLENF